MSHKMEKILNFRDAGLGETMAKGILFRSAALDRASEKDLKIVTGTLQVSTLIDLRAPKEVFKQENGDSQQHISDYYKTIVAGKDPLVLPVAKAIVNINLAHSIREAIWSSVSWMAKIWFVILMICGYKHYGEKQLIQQSMLGRDKLFGLNKGFLLYGTSYLKDFFEILTHKEAYPVIIHCSAGKDRTGLTIALLQLLMGVQRSVIVKEYAKSYDLLEKKSLELAVGKMGLSEEFAWSRPETMEKTLDYIDTRFGGIEKYLLSIGITADKQEKIKRLLSSGTDSKL